MIDFGHGGAFFLGGASHPGPAYRYWRLLAGSATLGVIADCEWALLEVQFLDHLDNPAAGTAISGGDRAPYVKANAFDGVAASSNMWASIQNAGAVNGAAWIGLDCGAPYGVRRARFMTYQVPTNAVTAAHVQHSADAAAWTTVATISTPSPTGNTWYETTW